ncbi:CYTH domain-containing protein [Azospirillum sp. A39]|uniref:CYTH domain-containing protein n=1 Tax=Azospirillum sp. A39 TaxID=3462279 RepID=UPI0040462C0C
MPLEIERRFLVTQDIGHLCTAGERIVQGYLPSMGTHTVRVRIAGAKAYLTIKTRRSGCVRTEVEWEIAPELAEEVLAHACGDARIEKTRYRIEHAGFVWEVDVFAGANAGLVIAEVELDRPDQPVPLPGWVGREITTDDRFGNSALCREPIDRRALAA